MFRTTPRVIGYLVLASLLLTGCKPSTSDAAAPTGAAGSSTAPDTSATDTGSPGGAAPAGGGGASVACDLVTEQDASTAIGSPAGPGTPGGTPALSECVFGDGALIVSMKRDSKALYDSARAQIQGKKYLDLPDVGDGGFEAGARSNATLEFIKGTTLVSILLATSNPSPSDAAIALARVAAAHL